MFSPSSSRDIQPPFAPFVHPKLPLAARLGLCWGARPSRWPFPASRPKPFPDVAAGILPAVEPWLPARRKKPSPLRVPQMFCDIGKFVCFCPGGMDARPLRQAKMPDATERARPGGRFRRRAAAPENSPAIHGWDSWSAISQSPVRDERCLRTANIFSAVPRGTFPFV
jgi:hypothetical protein